MPRIRNGMTGLDDDRDAKRDSDRDEDEEVVDESGYDADSESYPRLTSDQRMALRRYPREVTREDATITSATGSYGASSGKPKAHRDMDGNLVPAGQGLREDNATPITALDHLKGHFPNKGRSDRISFANKKKAENLRDYSSASKGASSGSNVTATVKLRKLMKAKMRGKPDVAGTSGETTNDIIRSVRSDSAGAEVRGDGKSWSDVAVGYAKRDAETHTVGAVPRRFVKYSDIPDPQHSDSDSDSVSEEETDYSDLDS